ncbi:MAG: beta-ketoacyl-[acyl-carrier-protein] synthase family protein [Burkholderiaceae bacterium]|nr:MAG: beta-ketoacyl-[acyl-carrier-protein] synthase family protein [Burkholderiaceae bacterium]
MNKALVYLNALGLVNALGQGKAEVAARLFAGDVNGLALEPGWLHDRPARVGRARVALPHLPTPWAAHDTRNNRLLWLAAMEIMPDIEAAKQRYGAARIGVVLGTSTSGIAEGEGALAHWLTQHTLPADYAYTEQELGAPAAFLSALCEVSGPSYVISTACTSSAKAFAAARRLLRAQVCDAVLVGGVDSLCRLTVTGFTALESTSADLTNPMSANRNGINIGEGAALFLMTREADVGEGDIALLGVGESSDAYHMSSPDPQGIGAELALRAALADAEISAAQIAYLNLHGTATVKNDAMESAVVARVFPNGVPCSSTKPLTGHTLGAAGATEAAFCWLTLSGYNNDHRLPPHVWDGQADADLPVLDLVRPGQTFKTDGNPLMMSNSFAFGGNNISLILGSKK